MSCVIDGCYSHSGRNKNIGEKVHFHSFPKDEKIKEEWIRRVGRSDWKWKTHSRICSRHFSPDNYCHNEFSAKSRLKSNAVPSFNLSEVDPISPERGHIHSSASAVQGHRNSAVVSEHGHIQSIPCAVPQRYRRELEGQAKAIENGMENLIKFRVFAGPIRLKKGIVSHEFKCQEETHELQTFNKYTYRKDFMKDDLLYVSNDQCSQKDDGGGGDDLTQLHTDNFRQSTDEEDVGDTCLQCGKEFIDEIYYCLQCDLKLQCQCMADYHLDHYVLRPPRFTLTQERDRVVAKLRKALCDYLLQSPKPPDDIGEDKMTENGTNLETVDPPFLQTPKSELINEAKNLMNRKSKFMNGTNKLINGTNKLINGTNDLKNRTKKPNNLKTKPKNETVKNETVKNKKAINRNAIIRNKKATTNIKPTNEHKNEPHENKMETFENNQVCGTLEHETLIETAATLEQDPLDIQMSYSLKFKVEPEDAEADIDPTIMTIKQEPPEYSAAMSFEESEFTAIPRGSQETTSEMI